MTERKSRKQTRPEKKEAAAKSGLPRDRPGQAPAGGQIEIADEAAVGAPDKPPVRTTPAVRSSDDSDRWGEPFPGGRNEPTREPALKGEPGTPAGLAEESESSAAPLAFPGWSSWWQAATTGSGPDMAFPGGNNPIDDRLPEQGSEHPFPGGLNLPVPDQSMTSSPEAHRENIADPASNDTQTQEAAGPAPGQSAPSSTAAKRTKRRKK